MKYFYLLLATLLLSHADNYSTSWVDKAVEEIQPPRTGVDLQELNRIVNPFLYGVVQEKKVVKKVKPRYTKGRGSKAVYFRVSAILNDSAKINNHWIKKGRRLSGYTLTQTAKEYVILQKDGKKPIKVYIDKKNKRIRLKTQ